MAGPATSTTLGSTTSTTPGCTQLNASVTVSRQVSEPGKFTTGLTLTSEGSASASSVDAIMIQAKSGSGLTGPGPTAAAPPITPPADTTPPSNPQAPILRARDVTNEDGPCIGHRVGQNVYKVTTEAADQQEFVTEFNTFKDQLNTHLRATTIPGAQVEKAVIYFSRGYVAYKLAGETQWRTINTSELGAQSQEISAQIDKVRAVVKRVWKAELIPTLNYRNGAIAPYGCQSPILGPARDPFLKKVFSAPDEVAKTLANRGQGFVPTDLYRKRVAFAERVNAKLLEKVDDCITRLGEFIQRPGSGLSEEEKAKLQAELQGLRMLRAQLKEEWTTYALPIVLAYHEGCTTQEDYVRAAEAIVDHIGTRHKDIHEKIHSSFIYKVPLIGKGIANLSGFAGDLGLMLIGCCPDTAQSAQDRPTRDAYLEFSNKHSDGGVKSEGFAGAFTRAIVQGQDIDQFLGSYFRSLGIVSPTFLGDLELTDPDFGPPGPGPASSPKAQAYAAIKASGPAASAPAAPWWKPKPKAVVAPVSAATPAPVTPGTPPSTYKAGQDAIAPAQPSPKEIADTLAQVNAQQEQLRPLAKQLVNQGKKDHGAPGVPPTI